MFVKSAKSILAVAVVAAGAAFATTGIANAGSSFGVYIGGGHGGYHGGHGGAYYGGYGPGYGYHGGYRHRGHCGPRRALNKAWHMGVNRPHIKRVGGKRIVVVGFNRGHRAKVVFKRHSRHCRVLKTRGLYRY